MAIRVAVRGGADLRTAADVLKRNLATPLAGGAVRGFTRAFFLQVPTSGWSDNTQYPLIGRESTASAGGSAGTAAFATLTDHCVRIGADASSSGTASNGVNGALRLRPRLLMQGGASSNAFTGIENEMTALTPLTRSPASWLVLHGITNTGTDASPVWRLWAAVCPVGVDAPSAQVAATAATAGYVISTTGALLRQIFVAQSAGVLRTPVDTVIEHVALIDHNFPWDAANNRPDLAVIAGLCGAGGNNYTYDSAAVLNGGAVSNWWPMTDLSVDGLANRVASAAGALAVNTVTDANGLANSSSIAPGYWNPAAITVADPGVMGRFTGGRGAQARTVTGSYDAGRVTGMQRRWVDGAGVVVPGFDWAAVTSFSGGAWSTTDTRPIGNHTIQLRATNNAAETATLADWPVGTVLTVNGQSGQERAFNPSGGPANTLGLALSAGVDAVYFDLGPNVAAANSGKNAGASPTYVQPQPYVQRLIGGTTPAGVGSGTVEFCNEWQASGGGPVMIVMLAMSGTNMGDWASNAASYYGSASNPGNWTFLGALPPVLPGAASAGGAGVMGTMALLSGRWADCHTVMWTPGFEPASANDYLAALDARFNGNPDCPVLVLPPWRGHRDPVDSGAALAKRKEHVDWAAALGARAVVGPTWLDIVSDSSGGLHSAFVAVAGGSLPVPDANRVGTTRLGRSIARAAAWVFNRALRSRGARPLRAYFRDPANRAVIEIETGKTLRTLGGAAVANLFFISQDAGATWSRAGFTVSLSGTKARLTKTSGVWPAANVRVDYGREWPFGPTETPNEADTERLLDGLLYDSETYRGGINFAAGSRPGNPMFGSNSTGIAVTDPDGLGFRLVSTDRFTGALDVVVRLVDENGATIAEKTITVTAA